MTGEGKELIIKCLGAAPEQDDASVHTLFDSLSLGPKPADSTSVSGLPSAFSSGSPAPFSQPAGFGAGDLPPGRQSGVTALSSSSLPPMGLQHFGQTELPAATLPGTVRVDDDALEQRKVVVYNLSGTVDEDTLRKYFEDCGKIDSIVLETNSETAKPSGTATITFAAAESAATALLKSGMHMLGRFVLVDRPQPRVPLPQLFRQSYLVRVVSPLSSRALFVLTARAA